MNSLLRGWMQRLAPTVETSMTQRGAGAGCSFSELVRLHSCAAALWEMPPPGQSAPVGGELKSLFRGHGLEYTETRTYQAGDDIRSMDWRVMARTSIPHIKIFQEEKERAVYLIVDHGPSMHFGTRQCFKSVQASRLGALLAWAAMESGEKVAGMVIKPLKNHETRPLSGQRGVVPLLKNMVVDPETDLIDSTCQDRCFPAGLQQVLQWVRKGSLIFLVSDFYHYDQHMEKILYELQRHRNVALLLVFDPLENHSLPQGRYRISDGRAMLQLNDADTLTRNRHCKAFQQRRQAIEEFSRQHRLRMACISAQQDALQALQGALQQWAQQDTREIRHALR